jgi:hypothetical protein
MKKRTFDDLCNQIENEDDQNDDDEDHGTDEDQGTSDGAAAVTKQAPKKNQNEMDSDSEDDALLLKIHNNIIGLLNVGDKSNMIEKIKPNLNTSKDF